MLSNWIYDITCNNFFYFHTQGDKARIKKNTLFGLTLCKYTLSVSVPGSLQLTADWFSVFCGDVTMYPAGLNNAVEPQHWEVRVFIGLQSHDVIIPV